MPSDVTGSSIYDQRDGDFEFRPGPDLHEPAARRRDQPRAAEDPGGAARGDAGAAGDDRGHDAPARAAVPRPRDPEPDRVRGHLSAARGAARPLPAADGVRLPEPRRRVGGARRGASSARRTRSSSSRSSTARRCSPCSARSSRCTSPRASATTSSTSSPATRRVAGPGRRQPARAASRCSSSRAARRRSPAATSSPRTTSRRSPCRRSRTGSCCGPSSGCSACRPRTSCATCSERADAAGRGQAAAARVTRPGRPAPRRLRGARRRRARRGPRPGPARARGVAAPLALLVALGRRAAATTPTRVRRSPSARTLEGAEVEAAIAFEAEDGVDRLEVLLVPPAAAGRRRRAARAALAPGERRELGLGCAARAGGSSTLGGVGVRARDAGRLAAWEAALDERARCASPSSRAVQRASSRPRDPGVRRQPGPARRARASSSRLRDFVPGDPSADQLARVGAPAGPRGERAPPRAERRRRAVPRQLRGRRGPPGRARPGRPGGATLAPATSTAATASAWSASAACFVAPARDGPDAALPAHRDDARDRCGADVHLARREPHPRPHPPPRVARRSDSDSTRRTVLSRRSRISARRRFDVAVVEVDPVPLVEPGARKPTSSRTGSGFSSVRCSAGGSRTRDRGRDAGATPNSTRCSRR